MKLPAWLCLSLSGAGVSAQCVIDELPASNDLAIEDGVAALGIPDDAGAGENAGAVRVFRRDVADPHAWIEVAVLRASDAEPGAGFGSDVALDGGRMLVAARAHGGGAGRAYIFEADEDDADGWVEVAQLESPESDTWAFGRAVAIDANTAVVSAYRNFPPGGARVFLFQRNLGGPDNWGYLDRLYPGEETTYFGGDLALDRDALIVGTRIDGDDAPDPPTAVVFQKDWGGPDNWGRVVGMQVGGCYDCGSIQVELLGDVAAVAASCDDNGGGATLKLYERNLGGTDQWGLRITHHDPNVGDFRLATSLALDGDVLVLGSELGADVFFRHAGGPDAWGLISTLDQGPTEYYVAADRSVVLAGYKSLFGPWGGVESYDLACGTCHPDRNADGEYTIEDLCRWHESPCDVNGNGVIDEADSAVIADLVGDPFDDCNGNIIPDACEGAAVEIVSPSESTQGADAPVAAGDGVTVVGAYLDDTRGADAGAAFLFHREGGEWAEWSKLAPPGLEPDDRFGRAVAVGGGVVVIGADLDDEAGNNAGAAYVYRLPDRFFVLDATLRAPDAAAGDHFGRAVAAAGDRVLVGAYRRDDQRGAAYVFLDDAAGWQDEATLLAPDAAAGDRFGLAVALDDDFALVGSDQHDETAEDAGAAYVFARAGAAWSAPQKLLAPDGAASDRFGRAVALSGDVALVGAPGDDTGAVWVYRFDRAGADWTAEQKLTPSDGTVGDSFGRDVSVRGDLAYVGARDHDSGAGTAYLFQHAPGAGWTEIAKETASAPVPGDAFGAGVVIAGGVAVIGAPGATAHESSIHTVVGALDLDANGVPDDCDRVGDLDGDGVVAFFDLILLLAEWGECREPPARCPADLDGDFVVGFQDLLVLLFNWG